MREPDDDWTAPDAGAYRDDAGSWPNDELAVRRARRRGYAYPDDDGDLVVTGRARVPRADDRPPRRRPDDDPYDDPRAPAFPGSARGDDDDRFARPPRFVEAAEPDPEVVDDDERYEAEWYDYGDPADDEAGRYDLDRWDESRWADATNRYAERARLTPPTRGRRPVREVPDPFELAEGRRSPAPLDPDALALYRPPARRNPGTDPDRSPPSGPGPGTAVGTGDPDADRRARRASDGPRTYGVAAVGPRETYEPKDIAGDPPLRNGRDGAVYGFASVPPMPDAAGEGDPDRGIAGLRPGDDRSRPDDGIEGGLASFTGRGVAGAVAGGGEFAAGLEDDPLSPSWTPALDELAARRAGRRPGDAAAPADDAGPPWSARVTSGPVDAEPWQAAPDTDGFGRSPITPPGADDLGSWAVPDADEPGPSWSALAADNAGASALDGFGRSWSGLASDDRGPSTPAASDPDGSGGSWSALAPGNAGPSAPAASDRSGQSWSAPAPGNRGPSAPAASDPDRSERSWSALHLGNADRSAPPASTPGRSWSPLTPGNAGPSAPPASASGRSWSGVAPGTPAGRAGSGLPGPGAEGRGADGPRAVAKNDVVRPRVVGTERPVAVARITPPAIAAGPRPAGAGPAPVPRVLSSHTPVAAARIKGNTDESLPVPRVAPAVPQPRATPVRSDSPAPVRPLGVDGPATASPARSYGPDSAMPVRADVPGVDARSYDDRPVAPVRADGPATPMSFRRGVAGSVGEADHSGDGAAGAVQHSRGRPDVAVGRAVAPVSPAASGTGAFPVIAATVESATEPTAFMPGGAPGGGDSAAPPGIASTSFRDGMTGGHDTATPGAVPEPANGMSGPTSRAGRRGGPDVETPVSRAPVPRADVAGAWQGSAVGVTGVPPSPGTAAVPVQRPAAGVGQTALAGTGAGTTATGTAAGTTAAGTAAGTTGAGTTATGTTATGTTATGTTATGTTAAGTTATGTTAAGTTGAGATAGSAAAAAGLGRDGEPGSIGLLDGGGATDGGATDGGGGTADADAGEVAVGETAGAAAETAADVVVSPLVAAEQIVADVRWRLDIGSLREVVDDRVTLLDVAERLEGPLGAAVDNPSRARMLCLRAQVQRLLGELDRALADSRLALAHGHAGDDDLAVALARTELAQVLRLRAEHVEADRLFLEVVEADVPDAVRSLAHENAGRASVDQGRYLEACDHFGRAMRLGDPADVDLVARLELALDAIYIRVLKDGWGPSPRRRTEIMSAGRLPVVVD